jgi:hypothetical protein
VTTRRATQEEVSKIESDVYYQFLERFPPEDYAKYVSDSARPEWDWFVDELRRRLAEVGWTSEEYEDAMRSEATAWYEELMSSPTEIIPRDMFIHDEGPEPEFDEEP